MESPFKDPRLRACLAAAALLIGGAYLAIKDHVLFSRRRFGEKAPVPVADVFGAIYAIAAAILLWYARRLYRMNTAARKPDDEREADDPPPRDDPRT